MSGFWAFLAVIVFLVFLIILINAIVKELMKYNKSCDKDMIKYIYFKRFLVKKQEKAFLYKENEYYKILLPGIYWYFDPFNKFKIELYDIQKPEFKNDLLEYLIKKEPALVAEHFFLVDLNDFQVGILYLDGKMTEIIPPSTKKAFWKGIYDIKVETLDIKTSYELPEDKKNQIAHTLGTYKLVTLDEIKEGEVGLLYIDNVFVKNLNPGIYSFWKHNRFVEVKKVDLRLQILEITGQEIITSDKVSLRINLSSNYIIKDPLKVVKELNNYKDYMYKELQFALREVVGNNSLDELLSKKDEINKNVLEIVKIKISEFGIELKEVGIKDIILPGDMRDLMNKVVEAEKQAQANIIKRREETAATRSQLNTVKVMENNPIILRMKELEAIERICEKINTMNVYGGFDGLLNDLIKLRENEKS